MSVGKNIPKVSLGLYPTPLQKAERFSAGLQRKIWIKRDDLCGVVLGGNKVRKLEYLLADALENGCDYIITTGAAQSNHATLAAASCRRLGLEVELILKGRGVTEPLGNLLLDELMNVPVTMVDSDDYRDVYAAIDKKIGELEAAGRKPYLIPVGGSVPLGALGYVDCVSEMAAQAEAQGFKIDHIVACSGSGGTHAGLLLGGKLMNPDIKVTGIVASPEKDFQKTIFDLTLAAADLLGVTVPLAIDDVVLKDYTGPGYAQMSKAGLAAIKRLASEEGIFLDPVYTGKGLAGLLDLNEQGYFQPGENIVFIHSGGAPAIFAVPANAAD